MEHAIRIDPVAKRMVSVYLNTFLWRRSPAIRDQQVADAKEADFVHWAHRAAKRYGVPSSLHRDVLRAAAAAAGDVNGLMAEHWQSTTFQRWLLYSMSWVVLRCTESAVTVPDGGLVQLGGRGLLDPKAELYFPLSSRRVLAASWRGGSPDVIRLLSASPAQIRGINKYGIRQAGRFVYGQKYSRKVAETVQRSSHNFPKLKPLCISGSPSPVAARLKDFRAWYARVTDDYSDTPDRHWCMGPGAGDQCRHKWQQARFELPLVIDAMETKVSVSACKWCGALEFRYANGYVRFDDFELRRTTVPMSRKNWWQSLKVVASENRIEACGEVPIYRVAGPGEPGGL